MPWSALPDSWGAAIRQAKGLGMTLLTPGVFLVGVSTRMARFRAVWIPSGSTTQETARRCQTSLGDACRMEPRQAATPSHAKTCPGRNDLVVPHPRRRRPNDSHLAHPHQVGLDRPELSRQPRR